MPDTVELTRDCEAIAIPSGRRKTLPSGTAVRIVQTRDTGYVIAGADHAMYRIDIADSAALGLDAPAHSSEATQPTHLAEKLVWDTLKTVFDPELPVNIVELGLVYSCAIAPQPSGGNSISIRMAMTSPGCGMSDVLKAEVQSKLARLPEVSAVNVEVVFDPPWDPSRVSESARLRLGIETGAPASLVQIAGNKNPNHLP